MDFNNATEQKDRNPGLVANGVHIIVHMHMDIVKIEDKKTERLPLLRDNIERGAEGLYVIVFGSKQTKFAREKD